MKKTLIPLMIVAFMLFLGQCGKGDKKKGPVKKDGKTQKVSKKKKVKVVVPEGQKVNYGTQKAVYHFNRKNYKKTNGGLRNIKNHLNAMKGDNKVKIIAVFHGGAVFTLLKKPKDLKNHALATKIKNWMVKLKKRGVKFNVCKNRVTAQQSFS